MEFLNSFATVSLILTALWFTPTVLRWIFSKPEPLVVLPRRVLDDLLNRGLVKVNLDPSYSYILRETSELSKAIIDEGMILVIESSQTGHSIETKRFGYGEDLTVSKEFSRPLYQSGPYIFKVKVNGKSEIIGKVRSEIT